MDEHLHDLAQSAGKPAAAGAALAGTAARALKLRPGAADRGAWQA